MINDNEPESVDELKAANRALTRSLKRCQALVDECREKLAEGQPPFLLDEDAREADRRQDQGEPKRR